jgi:thioredoxin 1
MTVMKKLIALAILAAAVVVVVALKQDRTPAAAPDAIAAASPDGVPARSLPRLVDLGADKCIPCKMMEPILEELKTTHAGVLEVEFIDVWKNSKAAREYGVRMIPTQIFFGADGKELARHEGFMSREEILAKWAELGFAFEVASGTPEK